MMRIRHRALVAMLGVGLAACEPADEPLTPPPTEARFGRPDVVVTPGTSIQAAIDAARPGDRILVRPGRYRESLRIDKSDIHLIGLGRRLGSAGQGVPVIENPGAEEDGIRVTDVGDGVEIANFVIRGFGENGVFLVRVDRFRLSELVTEDDGEYGLFPVASSNGVIEDCVASGHSDTGIYVGQSRHV